MSPEHACFTTGSCMPEGDASSYDAVLPGSHARNAEAARQLALPLAWAVISDRTAFADPQHARSFRLDSSEWTTPLGVCAR